MPRRAQLHMILHGVIILLLGMLSGFPLYGGVIGTWGVEAVGFWRSSHAGLIANAIWLVVAGLTIPHIALGDRSVTTVATALIVANYAFVVEVSVVAWLLTATPSSPQAIHSNWVVIVSSVIFTIGSFAAAAIMIRGAHRALCEAAE